MKRSWRGGEGRLGRREPEASVTAADLPMHGEQNLRMESVAGSTAL